MFFEEKDTLKLQEGQSIDLSGVENFDLKFEFSLSKNSEGGIQYFSNLDNESLIFQIIDNNSLTEEEKNGNQSLASLKNLIASKNLCVPGRHRDFRGLDNWNTGRIIVKKGKMEHWMNGYKMVEQELTEVLSDWENGRHEISFLNKNTLILMCRVMLDFKQTNWRN